RPVIYSPDGQHLAGVDAQKTARVWESGTGREIHSLRGSTLGVAFSADGRRLVTAAPKAVSVWDTQTGKEVQVIELQGPPTTVRSVAFNRDGQRLAMLIGEFQKPAQVKVWEA